MQNSANKQNFCGFTRLFILRERTDNLEVVVNRDKRWIICN